MAIEVDFEGTSVQQETPGGEVTKPNNGAIKPDSVDLNGTPSQEDVTQKDANKNNDNLNNNSPVEESNGNESELTLTAGDNVEFDGVTYTVAENGDLVNAKGEVFKKANEVKDWLAQQNIEDSNNQTNEEDGFTIAQLQSALGTEITDEEGKPVEFTNDIEGIKGYVKAVIDTKSNDIANGAINKLFTDIPQVKELIDYLRVNGTVRGFGEMPDRSGIKLDQNNEAQQEAIIRMAGEEFNNPSINENYIKYLKSTGALYDEAKKQLEALVRADVACKQAIQQQAEQRRKEEEEYYNNYWQGVHDIIASGKIGGYQIPASFVKTVNGQKMTLTPNDFYNYLYKPAFVDEQGNPYSAYQADLQKQTEEEYLNKELISAWLMFTGGTYKDLAEMAAKEENVRKLIVKSKEQRNNKTVRISKPKAKVSMDDIIF